MPLLPVHSLDDPALHLYRNLKDRELARLGTYFIAEGEHLVARLLASPFPVHSILIADRHQNEWAPKVPPQIPLYVAPAQILNQIVGYRFHSGIIAAGMRLPLPHLPTLLPSFPPSATLVILPELNNTENLGALIRISAAFGVCAILLGPNSCDPFYRQSIRVSMGAVFHLPIVQSQDLPADLLLLSQNNFQLTAAVLDDNALPLHKSPRTPRLALLFGSEAQGLSPEQISACHQLITIPMKLGTDSLNVAIAAAIFLHHFTQK